MNTKYGWKYQQNKEHENWHEVSMVLNGGALLFILTLFALAFALHA